MKKALSVLSVLTLLICAEIALATATYHWKWSALYVGNYAIITALSFIGSVVAFVFMDDIWKQ